MLYRKLLPLCIVFLWVIVASAVAQDATPEATPIDLTPPTLGEFDPASVQNIDLTAYPILPDITPTARQIYTAGQTAGNNAQVFSKVGDCMTAPPYFLVPFAGKDYNLGVDSDLQPIIDYFSVPVPRGGESFAQNSFNNPGLAALAGFSAASVLDSTWADPAWCQPNESPLSCEYRLSQPAFVLIMFGTNDVYALEAASYDFYMRSIVVQSLTANIVPVLYTFPSRPEFREKTRLFNQIVVKIAQDYDLPLVNLWLAIKDLPDEGIDAKQPIHLSIPTDEKTGDFVNNMQFGYTVRNRITLQTLARLLAGVGVELIS